MTANQFNTLSIQDKYNTLLERGAYLLYQHLENYTVLLFQLDTFYVEQYYAKSNEARLLFRTLETADQLEPYLNQIAIPPIWLPAETGCDDLE